MSNSQFPGQIDQFYDPVPTTQFDDQQNPHHLIESRQNDAIDALEVKVGINGSTDSNSLDFKINQMIRSNGWLGGIVPNPSEFQSPVQFDQGTKIIQGNGLGFLPINAQQGAIVVINPIGGTNSPFISLAQYSGSGNQTLVRAVALGVSSDGLDAITNGAGPINIIDAVTAKLVAASLTNPNNQNLFLCGSNPPTWVLPPAGGGGGTSYLTTFNPFTIPGVGGSVAVTVTATGDIVPNAAYMLTDGTHFINAVAVSVAGSVVTFLNVGCGGQVAGSMAGGHIYAGNVSGPASASVGGSVPIPPNSTAKWFRGDATWAGIALGDITTALGYTPANKAGDVIGPGASEFSGFVTFDAGISMRTAGGLYIAVPTVAPSSANARSGQVQLTNVANDGRGPTLSFGRVNGGNPLNAAMLYLDGSGLGVVTDTAGPQNIVTTAAKINPAAIPPPTTSAPGIAPALPPASGAGSQPKTWHRGDNTWQQLPEVNYLSAPFIVPAIGSTVVTQFYSPYPTWPTIPSGIVYFSDGTTRGFLTISAYNAGTGQLTLLNQGSATAAANVGADCMVRLSGPSGAAGAEDVGTVKAWPSVSPPVAYMLMDGSAISRSLYPDLFTLIGTTFGPGDGSTTFNLPDARSKFMLGTGQGSGLTNRVLAAIGGEENHQLVAGELASHSHAIAAGQFSHQHTDAGHLHSAGYNAANLTMGSTPVNVHGSTQPGYGTSTNSANINASALPAGATNNTGSDVGHNNMPPFLVLTYIIKVSKTGGSTSQAPIADQTQPGLLNKLSGNTTDYVGGDNACHSLAGLGLGRYYGADTTNSQTYAVSVNSDFTLTIGVVVWITLTNSNTGIAPTLNVNGTGAKTLVNRAGITLNANEVPGPKTHGVVYDGTNWRIFTFLARVAYFSNVQNPNCECQGFDSVTVEIYTNTNIGLGLTLSHLGQGVSLDILFANYYSAGLAYAVAATNPAGGAYTTTYFHVAGINGGTNTAINTANTLNANTWLVLTGQANPYTSFLFLK